VGLPEQAVIDFIENIYISMQWPGVVALMATETIFVPLPSEIVMPLAGWMLIKERALPISYILVAGGYGALGSTIGAILIYITCVWGGRPLLEKYGKYVLISRSDLTQADRWFAKRGSWAVFICRLLPVVRSLISLPAGIARMHPLKFLIYTFTGSFIWCTGLAYAGYQLGEHWEQIRTVMRPFDPIIITLVMVLIGYYLYQYPKRQRQ